MSKIFLAVLLVLVGSFALVVADGLAPRNNPTLGLVTEVTRLPGMAFSTAYFEPRCRPYSDYSDVFFPGMLPINYLDFVYAK